MTTTIPALRADMGTWTYYITRMRAAEICEQVGIASETEEWEGISITGVSKSRLPHILLRIKIASSDQSSSWSAMSDRLNLKG